jgi:hypothetical protein
MKTLKREEICANEYRDLDHLRANIAEFFDSYYNRVRLHSALGYKTPEFGVPIAVCLNRRGHPTKLSHNLVGVPVDLSEASRFICNFICEYFLKTFA